MSTDEDYLSFLTKANQPTSTSNNASTTTTASSKIRTKAVDSEVPSILQNIDAFYTSDTDEPFQPVSLHFSGSDLTEKSFAELVGHDGEVEALSVKEFDPRRQYGEVVRRVEEAAGVKTAKVKVFRVGSGGTRVQYWVVAVSEEEGGRVVGFRADAVES